jgi:hypothetical protein
MFVLKLNKNIPAAPRRSSKRNTQRYPMLLVIDPNPGAASPMRLRRLFSTPSVTMLTPTPAAMTDRKGENI